MLNSICKSNLNHPIKYIKCKGMYAQTCCYLRMNFNLMKNFIFQYFHEHKNSKLLQFTPISKRSNFWVLQIWSFRERSFLYTSATFIWRLYLIRDVINTYDDTIHNLSAYVCDWSLGAHKFYLRWSRRWIDVLFIISWIYVSIGFSIIYAHM